MLTNGAGAPAAAETAPAATVAAEPPPSPQWPASRAPWSQGTARPPAATRPRPPPLPRPRPLRRRARRRPRRRTGTRRAHDRVGTGRADRPAATRPARRCSSGCCRCSVALVVLLLRGASCAAGAGRGPVRRLDGPSGRARTCRTCRPCRGRRAARPRAPGRLRGRRPRRATASPLVIRNAPAPRRRHADADPLLAGRSPALAAAVARLEAAGGVRPGRGRGRPADELAAAHRRYAAERDAALPAGAHRPAPERRRRRAPAPGVKCLHAHYAWHLAGGDDPVGRWVAELQLQPTPVGAGSRDRRRRHRHRLELGPAARARRARRAAAAPVATRPASADARARTGRLGADAIERTLGVPAPLPRADRRGTGPPIVRAVAHRGRCGASATADPFLDARRRDVLGVPARGADRATRRRGSRSRRRAAGLDRRRALPRARHRRRVDRGGASATTSPPALTSIDIGSVRLTESRAPPRSAAARGADQRHRPRPGRTSTTRSAQLPDAGRRRPPSSASAGTVRRSPRSRSSCRSAGDAPGPATTRTTSC